MCLDFDADTLVVFGADIVEVLLCISDLSVIVVVLRIPTLTEAIVVVFLSFESRLKKTPLVCQHFLNYFNLLFFHILPFL